MTKWKIISLLLCAALMLAYAFCLPRTLFDSPVSAVLLDKDGKLLRAHIAADGQWRFPPGEQVPDKFAKCIIAYEDKRFKWHPGVDPIAVFRAIGSNLSGGRRSGASTITMQTIRLSRPDSPRTFPEKMLEAVLATRLELRCSKREILQLYADNAPFGGNVVGIQAASWRYWGRDCSELSWAEAATLAVLPNSPSNIHPGKGRQSLLEKRNLLLNRLHEEGVLDSLDYALALEEPLPDKPKALPDHAWHYLETLRKEKGDGLFVSSLDGRLQLRAEGILEKYHLAYVLNAVHNIAAVILDVATGEPLVYCGNTGHGRKIEGCDVDVAVARRSSGSVLKPLLYAAMLDEGLLLPKMLVADIPSHYKDFAPSNFNHSYDGAVPADEVIRRSLNVPSVRMLKDYGTGKFVELLQDSGFKTIDRGEEVYGLSLVLGGAEISLSDLASVYRNMAFKLKSSPQDENASVQSDGVLCQGCKSPLSRGAIWLMTEALRGLVRPEEEIFWQNFSSSRDIAWKTGTSYGNRDAWSVGFTPEYVIAVWVGNSSGEGRPQMTGVGYAAPIMFDLLSLLPPCPWFECPYDELTSVEACSDSGYPVSELCPDGHRTSVLLPSSAPSRPEICSYHQLVHLSPDGMWQVDSECCEPMNIRNESWFVLPPVQQWYYRKTHPEYKILPPYHPLYKGDKTSPAIQITYPQPGMSIFTPIALDGISKGVVFSAAHHDPKATLFWHLDSQYLGETSGSKNAVAGNNAGIHKLGMAPEPGRHVLLVTDSNGNSDSVIFEAK